MFLQRSRNKIDSEFKRVKWTWYISTQLVNLQERRRWLFLTSVCNEILRPHASDILPVSNLLCNRTFRHSELSNDCALQVMLFLCDFKSVYALVRKKFEFPPLLELVIKELNHLAAILHVYAGGLNFIK